MLEAFTIPVQFLKGVGPRRAEALAAAGVVEARDLLWYLPRRYLDRSTVTPIGRIREAAGPVTIVAEVRSARSVERGRGKSRFELRVGDSTGTIDCVWFRSLGWIKNVFRAGDRVAFHGRPQEYGGRYSLIHPDFDRLDADTAALDTGRIIPLYPGGAAFERVGLNSRAFRRIIYHVFKEHGLKMPEVLPEEIRTRRGLLDGRVALR
ncbi:MAG TPA: OB-fold nucleic acid binding domain-containing protein, partial [Rhodothermales bacterium]